MQRNPSKGWSTVGFAVGSCERICTPFQLHSLVCTCIPLVLTSQALLPCAAACPAHFGAKRPEIEKRALQPTCSGNENGCATNTKPTGNEKRACSAHVFRKAPISKPDQLLWCPTGNRKPEPGTGNDDGTVLHQTGNRIEGSIPCNRFCQVDLIHSLCSDNWLIESRDTFLTISLSADCRHYLSVKDLWLFVDTSTTAPHEATGGKSSLT